MADRLPSPVPTTRMPPVLVRPHAPVPPPMRWRTARLILAGAIQYGFIAFMVISFVLTTCGR